MEPGAGDGCGGVVAAGVGGDRSPARARRFARPARGDAAARPPVAATGSCAARAAGAAPRGTPPRRARTAARRRGRAPSARCAAPRCRRPAVHARAPRPPPGRNASMRSTLISNPARGLGASGRSRRPLSAIWYQSCTSSGRRRAASASTSTPLAFDRRVRHELPHLHAMQRVGQRVEHAAPVRRELGQRADCRPAAARRRPRPARRAARRPGCGRPCRAWSRPPHRRAAAGCWRRCRRSPGRAATGRRAGCRRRPCASWRIAPGSAAMPSASRIRAIWPPICCLVQALEVELQAARQHRHRQLLRVGGREQELHVLRRLFQRLQQRVERRLRQHVHFVDQVDLVRGRATGMYCAFSISSRTSSTPVLLAASISSRSMKRPASMSQAGVALAAGLGRRAALAVQRLGEDARDRGLADAARAGEQEGMVDAARNRAHWSARGPRAPARPVRRNAWGATCGRGRGRTCRHSATPRRIARRDATCGRAGRVAPQPAATRAVRPCSATPARLEFAALKTAGRRVQGCGTRCGEVSEWLKEHAWKVCKRLNRASGVRIPLSPPASQAAPSQQRPARNARRCRSQVSMVAPSAPRDARSKTPPGPEGSNGID